MGDAAHIPATHTILTLDDATRHLVRLAAIIAGCDDEAVRGSLGVARQAGVPIAWIEELILQSHLFTGLPRALNAMREWRRLVPAVHSPSIDDPSHWRERGEGTCALVYGDMYDTLRSNIVALHPALDDWMIVDGYGKVLGRPGLDLARRELCIVAACAISRQDRQLHSHLHGALNVGVAPDALSGAVDALADLLGAERAESVRLLLGRVARR